MRNVKINEAGHILVKNLSAFWIPEIKIEREIHGTVYTITGSYEGTELPDRKLTRIAHEQVPERGGKAAADRSKAGSRDSPVKKGYWVEGVGANKEYVTGSGKTTKSSKNSE